MANKKQAGFTLIEMMVSIAVFMLVMTVAASALLTVIDANRKAQSIKTAINNLNFVLEGVTKDMRMGSQYECLLNGVFQSSDCEFGEGVRYHGPVGNQRFTIRYVPADDGVVGYLERCVDSVNATTDCFDFEPLTAREANITNVAFYLTGQTNSCASVDRTQPMITMTISGVAGKKENTTSSFSLQTSASERNVVCN